jgi:hypothetical protein
MAASPDKLTAWLLTHRNPFERPRRMALAAAFLGPALLSFAMLPLYGSALLPGVVWALAAVTAVSWPIVASVAALPTVAALGSEQFIALRVTNVPEGVIVQSFITRALLRARLLVAVTLGSMFPLASGLALLHSEAPIALWQALAMPLAALPLFTLQAGAMLTLAAHGVAMALKMHNGPFAAVSALAAGMVAMLPAGVITGIVFNATARMLFRQPTPLLIAAAVVVNAVISLIPLGIGRTVLAGVRMRGLPPPVEEHTL